MARNRKRAKDRRPRRPQPVGSARADHEQSRDDLGLEHEEPATTADELESEADDLEPELPSPTADQLERDTDDLELDAPAPIAHGTPDVELAEAQLAVGRPELPRDGDGAVDEDELEREAADAGGKPGSAGGALVTAPPATPARKLGTVNRLITFLQGSWRELQRVQWPDRRQVMQATGVVIGFVIVAGVFLGVADTLSSHVVNLILTGKW